ncbi:MAG: membrane protein insertion efficiency factor YidD [Thermoanaerobaculia bacterium]
MGRRQSRRTRLVLVITLAVILGAIVFHDLRAHTRNDYGTRAAIYAIDQYRAFVSPVLSKRIICRFKPSCSAYGRASIEKYGLVRGGARAAWRIARCGPWTAAGTVDPP